MLFRSRALAGRGGRSPDAARRGRPRLPRHGRPRVRGILDHVVDEIDLHAAALPLVMHVPGLVHGEGLPLEDIELRSHAVTDLHPGGGARIGPLRIRGPRRRRVVGAWRDPRSREPHEDEHLAPAHHEPVLERGDGDRALKREVDRLLQLGVVHAVEHESLLRGRLPGDGRGHVPGAPAVLAELDLAPRREPGDIHLLAVDDRDPAALELRREAVVPFRAGLESPVGAELVHRSAAIVADDDDDLGVLRALLVARGRQPAVVEHVENGPVRDSGGMGGLPLIEEQMQSFLQKGPGRISPFFIPAVITNLASGQISIMFNVKGPNYALTSACASGAHSIGEATSYIRRGLCDVMIAGGSEATVSNLGVVGFAAMRALSTRNDSPETASRPWDKDRDGFDLGEGCGILCIESLEHAEKRGAPILCEITGYGVSSDANHFTAPAPEHEGGQRAMILALQDAGLTPDQISHINAHATSTPIGDGLESIAIKKVFGESAKKVWLS